MSNEVAMFKKHDYQLSSQLSRFHVLTNNQTDKTDLLNLRDVVIEHSEDYKNAVVELREFLHDDNGAVVLNNVPVSKVEDISITQLMSSLDAMIYKDILDNRGKNYDKLMERRDSFTRSQECYNTSLANLSKKSDELEMKKIHGSAMKVVEAVKNRVTTERAAQLER